MPEGPSIVILRESTAGFKGQKILEASGYSKIDYDKITHQKVIEFRSWGKHFLICFRNSFIRIHLLMFGSYRINEKKDANPALSIHFKNGELNFYTCSVRYFEENVNDVYDFEADVMSDTWNAKKAEKKLKSEGKMIAADALLDQTIFSGVGNIIKNEVLFRTRIHPRSYIKALPPKKLKELVKEAASYSWDFYEWKKKFELKQHWLIYKKKKCANCGKATRSAHIGKGKRLTTYCTNCQLLYK